MLTSSQITSSKHFTENCPDHIVNEFGSKTATSAGSTHRLNYDTHQIIGYYFDNVVSRCMTDNLVYVTGYRAFFNDEWRGYWSAPMLRGMHY